MSSHLLKYSCKLSKKNTTQLHAPNVQLMHDIHDIIEKRYPQFSVILQMSPSFFMKKDFKKISKSTLQIPFLVTTVCYSLVYSRIEKRILIVLFFSRNQSWIFNDAPPVLIAGFTTQFQDLVASWLGGSNCLDVMS